MAKKKESVRYEHVPQPKLAASIRVKWSSGKERVYSLYELYSQRADVRRRIAQMDEEAKKPSTPEEKRGRDVARNDLVLDEATTTAHIEEAKALVTNLGGDDADPFQQDITST